LRKRATNISWKESLQRPDRADVLPTPAYFFFPAFFFGFFVSRFCELFPLAIV
jgi:hypothetical protein